MLVPIPRLRDPSATEFGAFVRRRLPVVIEGGASAWPALSRWSFGQLRAAVSTATVRVQSRRSNQALDFDYREIPFEQLIDSIESGRGRDYLGAYPLFEKVPALSKDIETPRYVGAGPMPPRVFIGPKGALSPLHYDLGHVLSAQIVGRKRTIVVEFRRRDFVMHPDLRGPGFLSEVIDPEAPEAGDHGITPLRRWDCTALPGDLVFLPGRRHHFVRSLENSISISFFWYPPAIRALQKVLSVVGRGAF